MAVLAEYEPVEPETVIRMTVADEYVVNTGRSKTDQAVNRANAAVEQDVAQDVSVAFLSVVFLPCVLDQE